MALQDPRNWPPDLACSILMVPDLCGVLKNDLVLFNDISQCFSYILYLNMVPMIWDELLPPAGSLALQRALGCVAQGDPLAETPLSWLESFTSCTERPFLTINFPVSGSGLHVSTNVNSPFPDKCTTGPENTTTSPGQLPNGSFDSLCTFGSPASEGVGIHIQEPREKHSLISCFSAWLVSGACSRLCLAVSSALCISPSTFNVPMIQFLLQ